MALKITKIPERYRPGLAKIKSLPVESVSTMSSALEKAMEAHGLKALTTVIKETIGLTPEEAESIIGALHSLYVFKASTEQPLSEVVDVLIGAMDAAGGALAVTESDKPELASKLTRLLTLKSLQHASKVEQLKADHQTVFYDAKILTDLRPIFEEPGAPPVGAIIGHTLRIVCHEYGEHRELYFALDAEDLKTLREVAERAATKADSLKRFLTSSNIPDFST